MITQANPSTYQQQSIIVPSTDGPREILVTVAVGTGLAYNYDSGISSQGYVITVLNTDGYALIKPPVAVTSERVARLWLEGVLQLTDWTKDKATIVGDLYNGNLFNIQLQVKDCLLAAIEKYNDELRIQIAHLEAEA